MHYSEVLRDEFNKPVAVHGTTKDVTEQKLQQLKMEESERTLERYAQKLTDTLESIGDGFFTLTRDWVVSYWNHKAEELMGKQRHELVGRNIWDVFPEVKHLKFYSESHLSLKRNIAIRFEEQYPHTKTWFEVDIYPNKDGLSVYFKDITSRKNGEEHLRIVNERLEFVSKATTDAIWDWDLVNNTNYFNASFKQLFGHSHHTTSIEESWSAHIHPEDKDKVSDSLSRSISNSAISNWSLEYRFMRADGTIANVFDRGFIIRDEKGQAIRMVGAMQDLTRQKEAESLMRLSEKKYKLLFYQSYIPMWTFDALTYQITDANEAALNLYGYTRKEFLSMSVIDLRAPEEKAGFLEMMKRIQEKKQRGYRDIFLHVKKNGEQFYIEVTSHGIDLPSGLHFLVAGLDMTEKLAKEKQRIEEKVTHQKEVAKAIIQTQEKERSEIGKELHDNVNQILTTVKLYIENIRSFPEHKDCFIDKSIELSQRAINEIRFLSKQLVTPVMADLGFHATIVEMVAHYTTMNVFEIDLNLESESLEMDKDMQLTIYRIIQEQLNNIIKYAQATRVQISIQDMKDAIQVKVEDNGCGFDPQKASGGLGLKNIRNRAEVFKGQVNIQSAPGEGCSLQISFPGTDQGAMRNRES
jgi:PAS domain S-box-containing protein